MRVHLDPAGVVDLPHIDQLLAPGAGNVLWVPLAHQGLVGGLHRVHGVPRAGDSCSQIMNTGGSAHFEDQVLAAETET